VDKKSGSKTDHHNEKQGHDEVGDRMHEIEKEAHEEEGEHGAEHDEHPPTDHSGSENEKKVFVGDPKKG
jgi:hypothetical protein